MSEAKIKEFKERLSDIADHYEEKEEEGNPDTNYFSLIRLTADLAVAALHVEDLLLAEGTLNTGYRVLSRHVKMNKVHKHSVRFAMLEFRETGMEMHEIMVGRPTEEEEEK